MREKMLNTVSTKMHDSIHYRCITVYTTDALQYTLQMHYSIPSVRKGQTVAYCDAAEDTIHICMAGLQDKGMQMQKKIFENIL